MEFGCLSAIVLCSNFVPKSAYKPSGSSGWNLSRFLKHEAARSTPPWMGCQSIAGLHPALNSPVRIYTPGWREAL